MAARDLIGMAATPQTRIRWLLLNAWPHAHWALPAIAGVAILIGHRELLAPVMDNGGDQASHLHAQYSLVQALYAGDNLFGPLSLDFGLPMLRFYQSLLYLTNVFLHGLTGVDLRLVHNLVVALCFALSPFSYCYFLRKLGLRRFAAGLGSLVAIISVGSFGNSFEAYHGIGIATQAMGALFFPLFMGQLVGLLHGENRWSSAALAFAAAFLSHAMMAVYSVLAGALYFLTTPTRLRPVAARLALFAVFGAALVAFWALPFVTHTTEHRPVPDSITRGEAKRWWFNSVGEHEMVRLVASGRLLDDPPVVRSEQTDPLDKLMEKVSMGVTVRTRFPVVTLLVGLGLLVALAGFRRPHCRFLAAGFAFSLLLFTGPDDFPLLRSVPLMGLVQSFRCTYLVEFFAFGLVGLGLEAVLRAAWAFVVFRRRLLRRVLGIALAAGIACGVGACAAEILLLARLNTRVHEQTRLDSWLDSVRSLDDRGYPHRVLSMERWESYRAWLASDGFRAPCSHWGSVGTTSSLHLCYQTRGRPRRTELHALAGIRYVAGNAKAIEKYREARGDDGVALYQRLANGPDRRGRSNESRFLLDMGPRSFLRPLREWPLPVVCDDRQWLWLTHGWMERYRDRLGREVNPVPLRVERGELGESGLLEVARAVLYLDGDGPQPDLAALRGFVEEGGAVVAPYAVDGLEIRRASAERPIWSYLPRVEEGAGRVPGLGDLEAGDPPGVQIAAHDDPRQSSQRYAFDIDALEPGAFLLPSVAVRGWRARLDGEPLEVFPAGPDLLGVWLPAGAHRLELFWRMPAWHSAALAVSLVALLGSALALIVGVAARLVLRRALADTWRGGGGRG
jgi:hypothetical protein